MRAIGRHGLIGSMGRVGAAGDNATMESFFALLQKNVLDRRTWATRHELRIAIVTWIERTYHRRWRQDTLGRLTPTEFETSCPHQPHRLRDRTCHLSVQQSLTSANVISKRNGCTWFSGCDGLLTAY